MMSKKKAYHCKLEFSTDSFTIFFMPKVLEVSMKRIEIRNSITLVSALVIALISILTLFCYTPAYADDTSMGRTPEGVFPLQENDVIMESEEITVDLEKNKVECIFVFHNTGKSKPVFMGFPGKIYDDMDNGLTNDVNLEIKKFKTFVKGKELPVIREKSIKNETLEHMTMQEYSEFFTFTVPFKANEKITVRNTYDFTPTYDSIGFIYSGYVLQTGAMWKGTIGSAKVTFKLGNIKPYQIEKLNLGGFKFEGNTLVWARNDFEPKYNLQVTYNNYRYNSESLSNLTDDEDKLRLEINQKIASYNKVKELANKGQTDKLISLYNKAVKEYNSILALYIKSFLPKDKVVKVDTKIESIDIQKMHDYYALECKILGEEPVHTLLAVSHVENGNNIEDFSRSGITSCYIGDFISGIEYTITFTITDWLDRTEQKTIKYKVPAQSSDASVAASSTSLDIQPDGHPIYANNSTDEIGKDASNNENATKSNISNKSGTETQNGIDIRIIVGVLIGINLLGITVISVLKKRKKEQG